jgi:IS1 family transposase
MTGTSKNTIAKLLVELGALCSKYQDEHLRNLTCKRLQVDEIRSFCHAKQKNVPEPLRGQFGYGDVWTWTAIEAQTKLVPCWLIGPRDAGAATEFVQDLAGRLANRVQLTSDGLRLYVDAVEDSFGADIDYSQLQKIYGTDPEGEKRYSPTQCVGVKVKQIMGDPDPEHISTSYVERQNLTMRMSMRRFTRLTNAFSKKVENLAAAVALHFMHYNFVRIHQTLRITPAMAAGVTDKLWEVADIVELLENHEQER